MHIVSEESSRTSPLPELLPAVLTHTTHEPEKNEDTQIFATKAYETEELLPREPNSHHGQETSTSTYCHSFDCLSILRGVWNSGVTCMAIAAFIQSLAALFVKLTDERVPVFQLVAVRSAISMIASITVIRLHGISPVYGDMTHFWPLLVRGTAGAASMSIYYFAIFKLSLADVMTLFFTHPAMVVVLAWICKGERAGWISCLGIAFSLLGVALVAQPPFLTGGTDWSNQHLIGVGLCTLSAFLAAAAFVAIRFIPETVSSFSVALWFHTVGFCSSIIPLMFGWPQRAVLPGLLDSSLMLGIATCSFTSHAFIARAFLVQNASKVAAIGYLQVLFAHLYGTLLLHDPESLLGTLGSLVICLGVVAVSWPTKPAKEAAVTKLLDLSDHGVSRFVSAPSVLLTQNSAGSDSPCLVVGDHQTDQHSPGGLERV